VGKASMAKRFNISATMTAQLASLAANRVASRTIV
jgi:hypothetical protein